MRKFFVFMFIVFIVLSCKTPVPTTHSEWAAYCLNKTDQEFRDCLKLWNDWDREQILRKAGLK